MLGEARRLAGEGVDRVLEDRHAPSMPDDGATARRASTSAMGIDGTCDDRFDAVRDAFAANFADATPVADDRASVAVTVDGELVVDLWGGTVDQRRGAVGAVGAGHDRQRLVDHQDRVGAGLLMLADQGEIDLYAPVAEVWPEFAANGKGDVEVRHVMSHTAGLPAGGTRSRSRTSTTGTRRRRCSPPRSRGGSRARRRATTPSPRATSRARSSAGSPARRSASSSPRRSPGRSASTSTSGRRRARHPRRPT